MKWLGLTMSRSMLVCLQIRYQKIKQSLNKIIKICPKNKLKDTIDIDELNLDEDDPLLEAADQLSEPETPNISERFRIKENVKKDYEERKLIVEEQKLRREEQKMKDYDTQLQLERYPTETEKLPRDLTPPLKVIEKIEDSKSSDMSKGLKPYQQQTEISINNIKLEEEKKVTLGQAVQRISLKDVSNSCFINTAK